MKKDVQRALDNGVITEEEATIFLTPLTRWQLIKLYLVGAKHVLLTFGLADLLTHLKEVGPNLFFNLLSWEVTERTCRFVLFTELYLRRLDAKRE